MGAEHILILIGEIGGAATVIFGLFFYLFKLLLRTSFQHHKIESRGYGIRTTCGTARGQAQAT